MQPFQNDNVLWCLWILPFVAWVLFHAHRKRVAAARTFVDTAMVQRLMPALGGPRPWIKGILLIAGLGSLIVAGARPRFGVFTETVTQRGVDLFVLLDVSRSMTARDVAPSRLERAKSDVEDLLRHLARDRVGLIVFAGKPVVKVPLTNDQGFFRMVLKEVDATSAPRGGTLIGDAMRKAMEAMPRSPDRDQVLVLITDGEDQDSYAEDAAKAAAERGLKIFCVGLGDAREGARIPIQDAAGHITYLQYEGQEKWSKLNDQLLKQIALTTGGAYIPAGTQAYDLGQVYADHLADLARSEYQAEKRKRYQEQFQWFVFLGVALLLAEMGVASYPVAGRSSFRRDRAVEGNSLASGQEGGMNSTLQRAATAGLLAAFFTIPAGALAGSREAAQKVREGITCYQAGEYQQAAAAFTDADVAKPDDLRIAFDRGVALAAQGDDKAVELLQKAALSPEMDLAVRARYNLGCLAAAKAHKRFGEHPQKATPEVRKEGLAELALAVGHFRDCLRLDKEHADARHNLELIRLWIKSMQSLWEQNDRQKQREEMDLATFLQMLEEKQRALRVVSRGLASASDSPKRREALRQTEMAQRKLGEEIGPLKEKIEATLSKAAQPGQPSPPGPGGTTPSTLPAVSEETKQAIAQLQSMADEAGKAIETAAAHLHAGKPAEALKPQTEAVEKFNRLYRSVAPYPNLLGRAVATQQGLVTVPPLPPGEGRGEGKSATKPPSSAKPSPSPASPAPIENADAPEAAWNQDFVTHYSEALVPLAKEGLKQLQSQPATPPATPPPAAKGGPGANADEMQKQREGLQRSMEKAVELGPKVEKLSGEAVQLLRDRKASDALPKQQECLKLLKEIAEPLPKQDQSQQDKQDQKEQGQDKQDQQQQDQKEQEKQQQQQASQQQAEAAIQQAQQRQEQRKEMEKQLQRYLGRPGNVEKDW